MILDEDFKREVLKRLAAGAERMERFESDLHANTVATTANTTATATIAEWMTAWEGAVKVLDGLAKIAKPVGILAGAITALGALWLAIRHALGFEK